MKKPNAPLIINLACTGIVPTKIMTPYIPIAQDEIVASIDTALRQGVQMVHLHARDDQGVQTSEPDRYGKLISEIRQLPGGRELIVGVTTSGRLDYSFASRSKVLELDGDAKPDMASLTLSSLNFAQSASVNPPDTIRQLAGEMLEKNIKPELEVFDLGMANFVHVLAKEKLIRPPYYINVLLGNISGAQCDLIQLGAILSALPEDSILGVAGLGRFQLYSNGLGILFADAVRVGLEDNIWFDMQQTRLATNAELVQRVIDQAALFERSLMSRVKARELLGLAS